MEKYGKQCEDEADALPEFPAASAGKYATDAVPEFPAGHVTSDPGIQGQTSTSSHVPSDSGEYDSGLGSLISETSELQYRMDHGKTGYMMCFCNTEFHPSLKLKSRQGTEKDVAEIRRVFERNLGFKVDFYRNLTAGDMHSAITAAVTSRSDMLKECSSFAIVIMTHGKDIGTLYGTDKEVFLQKLMEPVKDCDELVGKPKMVFIQACRGKKFDYGFKMSRDGGDDERSVTIPVEADYLYVYSTADGFVSFQNPETGSWFIQTLCKILQDNYRDLDMLTMLTRLCYTLAYNHASHTPSTPATNNLKQVSCVTTTLTKMLKFPPK